MLKNGKLFPKKLQNSPIFLHAQKNQMAIVSCQDMRKLLLVDILTRH